jgi:hypothetical protein
VRRTIVTLLVATGIAVAGCSGQPSKSATTSPGPTASAARQVMSFGDERAGRRGILVVAKPAGYALPADPQRPKELTRGVKFDVTVRNTTKKALQASSFTFTTTTNGAAAAVVTDAAKNVGDKLPSDVLPGMERTFGIVVALPGSPAEVTVKIAFERANPLYWTGTA